MKINVKVLKTSLSKSFTDIRKYLYVYVYKYR